MTQARARLRNWLPQYFLLALIWGSSFAYTEAGLTIASPVGITATRHLIGSLALFVIFSLMQRLPKFSEISATLWRRMLVVALLLNVIPGTLFSFAQNYVSTVIAAIINAATPIMTLVMLFLIFRQEKVTAKQVFGLFIGLVGGLIALGISFNNLGENDPLGVLAVLAAISCYGFAIPYVKNKVTPLGESSTTLAHLQVLLAAVILLLLFAVELLVTGNAAYSAPANWWIIGQVVILGLGTGIGYIFHFQVIDHAGSAIASSIAYPTLLVSLVIGWLILGEPFSWNMPIGAVLIAVGSAITQRGLAKQKP